MPEPLDNLARELRSAVLASNHEKATRLTMEYAEALGRHWTALSRNERAASPVPKQSRELLNWAREMTLMQQAIRPWQPRTWRPSKRPAASSPPALFTSN
jgi:hypothetical protein